MPTLDWIGKKAVVNHHRDVPYRLIHCGKDKSVGDPDAGNLLVQGDNLEALKALLPYYAGKVKCIYIDPPYNTGNEGWVYNDNVNSPEIRAWLGATVGKEAEDLSRHDKWLCMMYPRLRLLKEFLSEEGAIFVSVDDNEAPNLRLVLDEIFGRKNRITNAIWHKSDSPKNTAQLFSEDHEHIVVYARNASVWRPRLVPRSDEMIARYRNPDNDPRGPWMVSDLDARNYYSKGVYPITTPTGRVISGPPQGRYWTVSKEKFDEMVADNRIWWGPDGNSEPNTKRFLSEVRDGVVPQTLWSWKDVGSTRHSKRELREAVGSDVHDVFDTPKPVKLIRRILQIASDHDSIVLDAFAGSGTTGDAVLEQNRIDSGVRKFILVEMEQEVSKTVTVPRISRKISGYPYKGRKKEVLLQETLTLTKLRSSERLLSEVDRVIAENSERFDDVESSVKEGGRPRAQLRSAVASILQEVGIIDPERCLRSFPHQLSGGMLQRVAIAAALATDPRLLLADEPTTALDVTTQAEVIALLKKLQKSRGLAILFITHDLDLAAQFCDRIAVMYAGRIVEMQDSRELYGNPLHSYTRGLLECRPNLERRMDRLPVLAGAPTPAYAAGVGCPFAPRCPDVMSICREREPDLRVERGRQFACYAAESTQ